MTRSLELELLDDPALPDELAGHTYRDQARIHRVLGDTAAIIRALRRDPLPVRRVLDIGCGSGRVLHQVRRRLRIDVLGVDRRPQASAPVPILQADAIHDRLPEADVAFCLCLAHHLSEAQLAAMIHNVSRSCRRFILMDLVRHPLPLILFRLFVAPFVSPVTVADGELSIRRSYTADEMRSVVASALTGTAATVLHTLSPIRARQIVDIRFP